MSKNKQAKELLDALSAGGRAQKKLREGARHLNALANKAAGLGGVKEIASAVNGIETDATAVSVMLQKSRTREDKLRAGLEKMGAGDGTDRTDKSKTTFGIWYDGSPEDEAPIPSWDGRAIFACFGGAKMGERMGDEASELLLVRLNRHADIREGNIVVVKRWTDKDGMAKDSTRIVRKVDCADKTFYLTVSKLDEVVAPPSSGGLRMEDVGKGLADDTANRVKLYKQAADEATVKDLFGDEYERFVETRFAELVGAM